MLHRWLFIGKIIIICLSLSSQADNQDQEVREILETIYKHKTDGEKPAQIKYYNLTNVWTTTTPLRNTSKLYVVFEDGPQKSLAGYAIIEGYPSSPFGDRIVNEAGFTKNQKDFYEKVVPQLVKLQNEVGDRSEQFWIGVYGIRKDIFIYEDVAEDKNYTTSLQYPFGLDIPECKVALRTLAKFHAMTAVLYERGLLKADDFDKSSFERNREKTKDFYDLLISSFVESIQNAWGSKWSEAANYVKKRLNNSTIQLSQIHKRNDKDFNVLNHGSFVISELLFKYGITDTHSSTIPVSMRMKSSSNFFYNTPALDLHKFLSTSPHVKWMQTEREALIRWYFEELIGYLTKFGYKGTPPTLSDIQNAMERTLNISLIESIASLQYILEDPKEKINIAATVKESWEKNIAIVNPTLMYGQNFISTMKIIVENEMDKHPIN